jgi:hypothetical protein
MPLEYEKAKKDSVGYGRMRALDGIVSAGEPGREVAVGGSDRVVGGMSVPSRSQHF